jgi:citrate lyase subunit beta / citryl-CoA lyase
MYRSFLFVPANDEKRIARVHERGADAVILDLEDAVAMDRKDAARESILTVRNTVATAPCPVVVRINPPGQVAHEADIRAVASLPLAAVMLPKAETPESVWTVATATGHPVMALIESARGLAAARAIAQTGARLIFGSIDFAADIGCAHSREALLAARSELVIASRLAGQAAPIDGVTVEVRDVEQVRNDAAYAVALGFSGKLLIHPAQIEPARAGFHPSPEEIAWAQRVLAAEGGVSAINGAMVDPPVRLRAEQIRRRATAAVRDETNRQKSGT